MRKPSIDIWLYDLLDLKFAKQIIFEFVLKFLWKI